MRHQNLREPGLWIFILLLSLISMGFVQPVEAAGSGVLKQGAKYLFDLFEPPDVHIQKRQPKNAYNGILPTNGTPESTKYPPGLWNVSTQIVARESLSKDEVQEVIKAYQGFYRSYRDVVHEYSMRTSGTENVELPGEKDKILTWSFNYDEMLIGALFGFEPRPMLKFQMGGRYKRYETHVVQKMKGCIRLVKGVDISREDLSDQLLERMGACATFDPSSRDIASIEFDPDTLILMFSFKNWRDQDMGSISLDMVQFIKRAQKALFDGEGYLYSDPQRQAARIDRHIKQLTEACKDELFLLRSACMPSPGPTESYELRQCIWADTFVKSSWFPDGIKRPELTCPG